jgi:hypothetical protein
MVYTISYGSDLTNIGFATSPDGVTWQKFSGNPVFTPSRSWADRIEYGTMILQNGLFHYWFSGYDGRSWQIGYAISPSSFPVTVAEVKDHRLPAGSALLDCHPNHFDPNTTIKYQLAVPSPVRLSVFDVFGREVSVLVDERRAAGVHEVKLDGRGLSSGVSFCRLETADLVQTRRLMLVR